MSGNVFVSPYSPVQQSGVRAKNPPDLVIASRNPNATDYAFFPGTQWLNINNSFWVLLGAPLKVANWATVAGAAGVSSLTGTANKISVSAATGAVTLNLIGPYTPASYTAHGVLIGEGAGSIAAVGGGTTGQFLAAQTGADPIWATPGGAVIVATLTGDDTVVVHPLGGNINVLGNGNSADKSSAINLVTTGSGSTLTVQETKQQFITNMNIVNGGGTSPYTTTATDYFIGIGTPGSPIAAPYAVTLQTTPGDQRMLVIKDYAGGAGLNNITITPAGGDTIDFAGTAVINGNYESLTLVYNLAQLNWSTY